MTDLMSSIFLQSAKQKKDEYEQVEKTQLHDNRARRNAPGEHSAATSNTTTTQPVDEPLVTPQEPSETHDTPLHTAFEKYDTEKVSATYNLPLDLVDRIEDYVYLNRKNGRPNKSTVAWMALEKFFSSKAIRNIEASKLRGVPKQPATFYLPVSLARQVEDYVYHNRDNGKPNKSSVVLVALDEFLS